MDVTLPNGTVIEDVPEGMSKADIYEKAIRNGLATPEDFGEYRPTVEFDPETFITEPKTPRTPGEFLSDTGDQAIKYLKGNMELPMGLGGSVAGTLAGTPFGPPGMLAGGIIGGSVGSGIGAATSDVLSGEDIDVGNALKEAAISLGIDVATLGLGKLGKAAYTGIKKAMSEGVPVETIAKKLATGEAADFGTEYSRIQSQELAEAGGLSLTPFQAGIQSKWQLWKENLSRTGFLSKGTFEDTEMAMGSLVRDELDTLIGQSYRMSSDELGQGISSVISEARNVISKEYGDKLTEISTKLSKNTVNLKPLNSAIDGFLKANRDSLGNSILNKKTMEVVDELKGLMTDVDKAPASFLLDFDKALNKKINEVSNFGSPSFDPNTARELVSLSKRVKVRIRSEMSMVDPVAGNEYKKLQKAYSGDVTTLFPEVNTSFVRNANKGLYSSIGNMFTVGNKVENIQAVLKSIDKAYSKLSPQELKKLPFQSADEAKLAIKESYMESVIGSLGTDPLDPKRFVSEAKNLIDPTHAKKARVILGKDFNSYKKLVNLMATASQKPESGLATLFLRGKEYYALAGLGTAAATGFVSAPGALGSAALILGGPVFMAKAATNPKYVNKLMMIDQMGKKATPEDIMKMASVVANDFIDDLILDGYDEGQISNMLGLNNE